jgi:hypothetical protein
MATIMISINMLKNIAVLSGATILLTGCGAGDFNYGKVKNIIEGSPVRLDAEYVMLAPNEVDCGVQNDLWEAPVDSGGHQIARLTQKARDLKFADDISVNDLLRPYVQIRGDFSLVVAEIASDKDGPEAQSKLVEAKIGVPFQHSCFPNPLPLMGVKKGNFRQDVSPLLLFRYNNGWYLDKFVHN